MWQTDKRGISLHLDVIEAHRSPTEWDRSSGRVSTLGLPEDELTVIVSDSITLTTLQAIQAPTCSCAALHLLLFPVKADGKQADGRRTEGEGTCSPFQLAQLTGS